MTEKEKALQRFCSTGEGAIVEYASEEQKKMFEELKEKAKNGND